MIVGFDGFSIAQLSEYLEGVKLFRFIEQGRAECFLSKKGCDVAELKRLVSERIKSDLHYDCSTDLPPICRNTFLRLTLIELDESIGLIVHSRTNWGKWEDVNFKSLRELDSYLQNLDLESMPFPESYKGIMFDPIKGERC
jgi:hypothetical protein